MDMGKITKIAFIIFFLITCLGLNGHQAKVGTAPYPEKLLSSLNRHLAPISGCDPDLPDSELACLADLDQAQVVGLGEATHGTHEYFAMKHRIFRYLVQHHGFRIFAFECDYAESMFFDDYINGGEGDLESLMKEKMFFWTWRTREVLDLLEWMRQYNHNRPLEDRLHFIGIDSQNWVLHPERIRMLLNQYYPAFLREVDPNLQNLEAISIEKAYSNPKQFGRKVQTAVERIVERVDQQKEEILSRFSDHQYLKLLRLLRTMYQAGHVLEMNGKNDSYRDKYMAENVLWLRTMYGESVKVALWAHNGHVENLRENMTSRMGYFLKKDLGKRYKVISFVFSNGQFNALKRGGGPHTYDKKLKKNSLNHLFSCADAEQFILRMDHLPPADPLLKWLDSNRMVIYIGASFENNPYRNVFVKGLTDILVFFRKTTASDLIPWTFSAENQATVAPNR
jgi:erythromycin esterase